MSEILDTHLAERPDEAEQLRVQAERLEIPAFRECGDQLKMLELVRALGLDDEEAKDAMRKEENRNKVCLLYTSDAADE